jgi:hypothetical protein
VSVNHSITNRRLKGWEHEPTQFGAWSRVNAILCHQCGSQLVKTQDLIVCIWVHCKSQRWGLAVCQDHMSLKWNSLRHPVQGPTVPAADKSLSHKWSITSNPSENWRLISEPTAYLFILHVFWLFLLLQSRFRHLKNSFYKLVKLKYRGVWITYTSILLFRVKSLVLWKKAG